MMKIIKYVVIAMITITISITILIVYNLNKGVTDYKRVLFKELPEEVQIIFKTKQNMLVEDNIFHCESVNNKCNCSIESKTALPFSKAWIYIKSCDKNLTVDFSLTSIRLFILTDESLFFPIVNSVAFESTTKISDVINIDKVVYGKIDW